MPYKFLEDVAIADVAFEATGMDMEEVFLSAAQAVTNTMVEDLDSVRQKDEVSVKVEADNEEMLLFDFLQEIIFFKDSKQLLLSGFDFKITRDRKTKKYILKGKARGEKIDPKVHEMLVDVKAITMHGFKLEEKANLWKATVVLDV